MFLMFIQNILGGGGGAINASVHPFSCLHTNTMKVRICRQDGKSDVMQLQTLGGITRNITHSVTKKSLFSNSHSGRKITEGNELWE